MMLAPHAILAWCGAAFTVTVVATAPLIALLQRFQFGKTMRRELGVLLMPPAHAAKEGVPTMGGIGLLLALGGVAFFLRQSPAVVTIAWLAAYFALLGLLDDLAALERLPWQRGNRRDTGVGFSARTMLGLQLAGALTAGLMLWPRLPLFGLDRLLPPPVAGALVAVLAIAGTVNGVNFADGLDGLAAGLLALALAGLGGAAWVLSGPTAEVAFAFAAAGGCLGFLVYNRHPARVFMGNVTSMGLGAVLAGLALLTGLWPLLPIVGAVFVAEVASVVLQVGVFRSTGGRRLFRMAPIHHHFEFAGWTERDVVRRFWLAGLAGAAATLLLAIPVGAALAFGDIAR
jgi:phospho-N-acetylmuramoyl-pentapeptide-transferase